LIFVSRETVYHRQIYSSVTTVDYLANNITTVNERVTNSQIETTEDRQIVPIVPGMTRFNMSGVLYKVTSILGLDNIQAVVLNPPAAQSNILTSNVTEAHVRSLLLSAHNGTTVHHPVGASHALNMINQCLPNNHKPSQ
jgi:hypothetical protein